MTEFVLIVLAVAAMAGCIALLGYLAARGIAGEQK